MTTKMLHNKKKISGKHPVLQRNKRFRKRKKKGNGLKKIGEGARTLGENLVRITIRKIVPCVKIMKETASKKEKEKK